MVMIRRGDIRWFQFERPDKRRPVLILGREDLLASRSLIPVVPLSTQIRNISSEVLLSPDEGLPSACVLKPEWIRAIERTQIGPYVASFPDHRWVEVQRAVLYILGLDGSVPGSFPLH